MAQPTPEQNIAEDEEEDLTRLRRLSCVTETAATRKRCKAREKNRKRRQSAAFLEAKRARAAKKAHTLATDPPRCGYRSCKAAGCPANGEFERQQAKHKCSYPGCRKWLVGGVKPNGRFGKYWLSHTMNCEDRLKEPLFVGGGFGYGRHLDLPSILTVCEPHYWRLMACSGFK